jgi:hypothetical protein
MARPPKKRALSLRCDMERGEHPPMKHRSTRSEVRKTISRNRRLYSQFLFGSRDVREHEGSENRPIIRLQGSIVCCHNSAKSTCIHIEFTIWPSRRLHPNSCCSLGCHHDRGRETSVGLGDMERHIDEIARVIIAAYEA